MVGFTNGEFVANKLNVDNVQVDGNTITSTDTNGAINLTPNGTGNIVANTNTTIGSTGVTTNMLDVDNVNINGNTIISSDTDGNLNITPNGSGNTVIGTYTSIDSGGNIELSRDYNGANSISIRNNYTTSAAYSQFAGYARGDAGGTTTNVFALSARPYNEGNPERANRTNLSCAKNGLIIRMTESEGSFNFYDYNGNQVLLVASDASGANGALRLPKNPAFNAINTSTRSNVTGNGTAYTIPFNSTTTNGFDQGSNYNTSTGVFTAPLSARYHFGAYVYLSGLATATTIKLSFLKSTGVEFGFTYALPTLISASIAGFSNDIYCTMSASDTIEVVLTVSGIASNTVDVMATTGSEQRSAFYGHLFS